MIIDVNKNDLSFPNHFIRKLSKMKHLIVTFQFLLMLIWSQSCKKAVFVVFSDYFYHIS